LAELKKYKLCKVKVDYFYLEICSCGSNQCIPSKCISQLLSVEIRVYCLGTAPEYANAAISAGMSSSYSAGDVVTFTCDDNFALRPTTATTITGTCTASDSTTASFVYSPAIATGVGCLAGMHLH